MGVEQNIEQALSGRLRMRKSKNVNPLSPVFTGLQGAQGLRPREENGEIGHFGFTFDFFASKLE